ncbi:hypothetical protein EYF80_060494 [Liparis tanakae]|uniref:Uncharacterized protein n=1 Tax=Liparis tanakae TaxID=230148 RepID=A0A4Z2EKW9_9TELE|nr:hypothetical protein EYF80_060494 [Liparis tanakae]
MDYYHRPPGLGPEKGLLSGGGGGLQRPFGGSLVTGRHWSGSSHLEDPGDPGVRQLPGAPLPHLSRPDPGGRASEGQERKGVDGRSEQVPHLRREYLLLSDAGATLARVCMLQSQSASGVRPYPTVTVAVMSPLQPS